MGRRVARATIEEPPDTRLNGRLETTLINEKGRKGDRMILDVRFDSIDIWLCNRRYVAVISRETFRQAVNKSFFILKIDRIIWAAIWPNACITYPGGPTQLIDPQFMHGLREGI